MYPLCATGILRTVNESPIYKNKEITISVGGPLFQSNRRLFNQGGKTLATGAETTVLEFQPSAECLIGKVRGSGE